MTPEPTFEERLVVLRDLFDDLYTLLYPDPKTRPIAGVGWCPRPPPPAELLLSEWEPPTLIPQWTPPPRGEPLTPTVEVVSPEIKEAVWREQFSSEPRDNEWYYFRVFAPGGGWVRDYALSAQQVRDVLAEQRAKRRGAAWIGASGA